LNLNLFIEIIFSFSFSEIWLGEWQAFEAFDKYNNQTASVV
jgi:hypothetical protein